MSDISGIVGTGLNAIVSIKTVDAVLKTTKRLDSKPKRRKR